PKGAKLFSGEREVGWVSSAAHSPSLGFSIALGFPLRDFTTPGTALTVEVEGRRYDATVRPLPFYAPHSAASQNKTNKPLPAARSHGLDYSLGNPMFQIDC